MRIRRRDRDQPETEESEPRVALYDQEGSPTADSVSSPAGLPGQAGNPGQSEGDHGNPSTGTDDPAPAPIPATTPPADENLSASSPEGAIQKAQEAPAEPSPVVAVGVSVEAPDGVDPVPGSDPMPPTDTAPTAVATPPEPAAPPQEDVVPPAAPAGPKHAMRAPAIRQEATELLNGSKPA